MKIRTLFPALAFLFTSTAFAAPVLDQSYEPENGPTLVSFFGQHADGNGENALYQSFTAGKRGTLSAIALRFGFLGEPTSSVTLSVFAGGNITAPAVASTTVQPAPHVIGEFFLFDLSTDAFLVDAGDFLSFVISTPGTLGSPMYFLQGDAEGTYGGGTSGLITNGLLQLNDQHDYYFKTFVSRASVPEPGTLALLGLGIAGLSIARRRDKLTP